MPVVHAITALPYTETPSSEPLEQARADLAGLSPNVGHPTGDRYSDGSANARGHGRDTCRGSQSTGHAFHIPNQFQHSDGRVSYCGLARN